MTQIESQRNATGNVEHVLPGEHVLSAPSREAGPPALDVLRAKLDAAIVAEAWDAVRVIHARIAELERAAVVDLGAERDRRKRHE